MAQEIPEEGDIVVFTVENTFPMGSDAERKGVVESVDESTNEVNLGIDGVIPLERIVEIRGKSPDFEE